jgi:hypothetical protein
MAALEQHARQRHTLPGGPQARRAKADGKIEAIACHGDDLM